MIPNLLLLSALAVGTPESVGAGVVEPPIAACRAAPAADPASVLRRALEATGLGRFEGEALRLTIAESALMDYQSDRTYAPFFSLFTRGEVWIDPATGVVRTTSSGTFIGAAVPERTLLSGPGVTFVVRDSVPFPYPRAHGSAVAARPMEVAAVLHDWANDLAGVRVVGRCTYRDYPRITLERDGDFGPERLHLSEETGVPVGLARTEPHYLFGQVAVEYVYSTWQRHGDFYYPGATFRVEDGRTRRSRTIGPVERVALADAPSLELPEAAPMELGPAPMLLHEPLDTVRVADNVFLLKNRAYTSAVALLRDTIFVLDATQTEDRARADSAWIARLFPGDHPVALVVTDLAWPHIGGLRFWVANGATVYSHRASEAFIRGVVERRWTLRPDRLERRRERVRLRFHAVDGSLALAGGALRLAAIDGIGAEGALIAYIAPAEFLWAGDFIQDLENPSTYATDVIAAVRRNGFTPGVASAMHRPFFRWADVPGVDEGRAAAPPARR